MDLRAELVISALAEDAWDVVGERFEEIGVWASAITEAVMDGPPEVGRVRTCQVACFGPIAPGLIKERLTEFDSKARSLGYEAAAGMPPDRVDVPSRRCGGSVLPGGPLLGTRHPGQHRKVSATRTKSWKQS
jgi:hypothetical protein